MRTAPVKSRYSRAETLPVAREICAALRPCTRRIIVAGSLRRRRDPVGDVEILYVPDTEPGPAIDFFAGPSVVDRAAREIERLVSTCIIAPRILSAGRTAWGPKNKLAVHLATGIPIDIFAATEENWFSYLVCRTGPASLNTRLAILAQERGYQWTPYGPGFRHLSSGRVVPIESERHLFEFLGLDYLEPWERVNS